MHLRNGKHGYGAVTKLLHWLTVVAVVAQFAVGWTMSGEEAVDAADERLTSLEERHRTASEAAEERFEAQFEEEPDRLEEELRADQDAAEQRLEARLDRQDDALDAEEDDDVSTLHIVLGLSIMGLALVRLLWRRTTPLPPWAEHLSAGERKVESWLEKALLTMLVVVPATGMLLIVNDTDLVGVHVTAQIVLLGVIAVHVGLVLKHTVVRRNRHLSRML